jgi:hypothetical protein
VPPPTATEATEAETRDDDRHDDDHATQGERMKLETTMLNRAGDRRVVLLDDDQRNYYGVPSSTRAGLYRRPLAWAVAAARVAWGAVTGQRDAADDHAPEAPAKAPLETR